jgi:DNA repair protein RadC
LKYSFKEVDIPMGKMFQIAKSDRPREKLQAGGPKVLSDIELVAVLLGSGTRQKDVFDLAGEIVELVDLNKGFPPLEQVLQIKGIGMAKAAVVAAALEFARRRIRPEGVKVLFPKDALLLIHNYADRKQEHFLCISLNGAKEVIATRVITVGLVNRTQVHPREVFADAITDRASAIIVAHNHPVGSFEPSKDDTEVTKILKNAGNTLGIRLLDHIIFNKRGYYSYLESGEMDVL